MGINFGYLLVLLFNLILILGWPLFAILALLRLRRRELTEVARAIWAALIVIVPYLGALAFWLVKPGASNRAA